MFTGKQALLLDMNSTFMFGEDRFGEDEDFSAHYYKLGGGLARNEVNGLIRTAYHYLDSRYPNVTYRDRFPSVASAIQAVSEFQIDRAEMDRLVDTFAHHELGHIPGEYIDTLHKLHKRFRLALVIDIWSPKTAWLETFEQAGINKLFCAASFSSDHGVVKPSPKPFERVLTQLGITKAQAIVIGDSPRRDLGGAQNAGIDCILVGGKVHPQALQCFTSLIELCQSI